MKLEKAVESLQGIKFYMEESFQSGLGGDVLAEYTLKVVDAETLLNDVDVNLDEINDEDDLYTKVEDSLYGILENGSDGVKRI